MHGGGGRYLPFVEALAGPLGELNAQQLRKRLGDDASLLAKLLPQIATRLPGLAAPPQMSPESERYLLFEAASSLLRRIAGESGLLLVLEDLHWADKGTLLLLQHLARQLSGSRLLVAGLYRNVEVDADHPLTSVLANLRRERLFERIEVIGLAEEDTRSLIDAIAEGTAPEAIAHALHQQTEGNPFFVEEILRHLVQQGVLRRDEDGLTSDVSVDEMGLPERVKEVIGRRLANLDAECVALLRQAAILGRRFRHDLLAEVSGKGETEVLDLVEAALRAVMIEELPGLEVAYSFSHELTRQTLLEELSHARRQRLHRETAEALERLYFGSLEKHLPELAFHFIEAGAAGDLDKAVEYARRAADRALEQVAYEEAARLYQMALQALELRPKPDPSERCELLLGLGGAKHWAGEQREGKERFREAADVARELKSAEQFARAALGFAGTALPFIVDADIVSLLQEALVMQGDRDSPLRARLLSRLAVELYNSDSRAQREELCQEAIAMSRRLSDTETLTQVLIHALGALFFPDNAQERLKIVQEVARLAKETGDREAALFGCNYGFVTHLHLGEVSNCDAVVELMTRLAEQIKRPIWQWVTQANGAIRAIMNGDFQHGEELSEQALAVGLRGRAAPNATTSHALRLVLLRRLQGRAEEPTLQIETYRERAPDTPVWRAALAAIYCETEREADARREFEFLAAGDFASILQNQIWLGTMAHLSETCVYLGDSGRAAILYDLLQPYAYQNFATGGAAAYGAGSRYLGLLATTMRHWKDAERQFDDALEMNTRMGARPFIALTQHDYAKMLLARRGPGDRKKAYALLKEALEAAREMGMKSLEERAQRLLESRRGLVPMYPDRLTQQEVNVLRLIATGRSNSEIGEELVLSVRTVERHITNIYGKIGVGGRVEAASYAMNHGLAEAAPRAAGPQ